MVRPTIADVARSAGVSKALVSMALNGRAGVSASTRERIRGVADDLGWRPSRPARALSTRRAGALGLVVRREPSVVEADPFFAAFIAGLEAVLAQRDHVLVLSLVPDAAAEERTYRRLVAEGRVDGVLLTDLRTDDRRLPLLAELGTPALLVSASPAPVGGARALAVRRDHGPGIEALVEHLVALGHRRIAHVAGDDTLLHARSRRAQHARAVQRAGLQPVVVPGDFTAAAGREATARLWDDPPRAWGGLPPTAVVYAGDLMALAGSALLAERGLASPSDVSVAGMDGSAVGAVVHPALTTLDNDPAGWGRAAATALLDALGDGELTDVVLPPARLVVRASTGPAPPGG